MSDHKIVYKEEAQNYQRLIAREDYQESLLPAIKEIVNPKNKDVIDLGSGTGRLACLLAPEAGSLFAFDLFPHMLGVAASRLGDQDSGEWLTAASDHRSVPLDEGSADLVISGWSFCYLVVWEEDDWEKSLEAGLQEIIRLLRKDGIAIIIETLGTGVESPDPPEKLQNYFQYLESRGFQRTWLRTDYQFQDQDEAVELAQFFFGEVILSKIGDEVKPILPECTGIWWAAREDIRSCS